MRPYGCTPLPGEIRLCPADVPLEWISVLQSVTPALLSSVEKRAREMVSREKEASVILRGARLSRGLSCSNSRWAVSVFAQESPPPIAPYYSCLFGEQYTNPCGCVSPETDKSFSATTLSHHLARMLLCLRCIFVVFCCVLFCFAVFCCVLLCFAVFCCVLLCLFCFVLFSLLLRSFPLCFLIFLYSLFFLSCLCSKVFRVFKRHLRCGG